MRASDSGPKKASLRDVALKAGIGIATASSVLNGSRSNTRVSAETRQRILDVARELNYHPNAAARALAGRPTKTIGVLFGLRRSTVAHSNPFAFAVIEGIVAGAAQEGYNITLFTEAWRDASQSLGPIRDGRVDGIIVIAASSDSDILQTLSDYSVPTIALSATVPTSMIPVVDVDNAAGARMATQHLLDLGHSAIAHLTGDENLSNSIIRRDSFLATLRDAGVECNPDHIISGTYEVGSGYSRTLSLLELPYPPTAIFAASDTLAIEAIQAARDKGLSVPEDLSVVGFDDAPTVQYLDPPLTTVRQELSDMGATAARLLVRILRGEDVPREPSLFPAKLIVRKSTAPPRR